MSELYLILHKVRGEPAFDVAEKVMIGSEEGWIIPTSGHRAYPLTWELLPSIEFDDRGVLADLPDHYSTARDETPMIDRLRSILKLNKPKKPTYRRF